MDSCPPYENLYIETYVPITPDLKLDYEDVSDYSISIKNPYVFVTLISEETPVVAETATDVEYHLRYSSDESYFTLNLESVPVELLDEDATNNAATIVISSIANTTIVFKVVTT